MLTGSDMVGLLRAAGEPTRMRVLALLAREELSVMELVQILDQSQPRVSRHLKVLTDAGLVERFPDGAWAFYRLAAGGPGRQFVDLILSLVTPDAADLKKDICALDAVRGARAETAAAYFARNAARWDEVRSLYVDETEVERAIVGIVGEGRVRRLIDLGTGAGRMLTLLGPRAERSLGLDLSQQMLNIARRTVAEADVSGCELRHGDICATGLAAGSGDLVVIHRVLHYLPDPAAALQEAARLLAPGGRLLIIDFAPHDLEHLRTQHQHRRLGFSDEEIERWLAPGGLQRVAVATLPPAQEGLTVKIWCADRAPAPAQAPPRTERQLAWEPLA